MFVIYVLLDNNHFWNSPITELYYLIDTLPYKYLKIYIKLLTSSSSSSWSSHSFIVQHSIVCCRSGGFVFPAEHVFAANRFLYFLSLVCTPLPHVTVQLDHSDQSLSSHRGSFSSLTGFGGQYLWTASQLALSVSFLWQMYLLSSVLYLWQNMYCVIAQNNFMQWKSDFSIICLSIMV